ncbi:hypothetical protein WL99_11690 [Burkholderia cepacia]|uniref:hypothetical protein n=1 Tax=Burkholderia cepacia TaxID=292 RepID=UPI00076DE7B9|nr:hypothetical protein [Burkholderia cepacia]KWH33533.1 hypothetical protein WL99_11690 [Burkholderia cepacia]
MEPLWEHRWQYVDSYYGVIDYKFWMTDEEAARWHAYGQETSRNCHLWMTMGQEDFPLPNKKSRH